MAIDTTELQQLRDALIRARAKGVRELEMAEERIKYGSDAEMASAIRDLDARIARATTPKPKTISFTATKGL